jgi:hypothetical protein
MNDYEQVSKALTMAGVDRLSQMKIIRFMGIGPEIREGAERAFKGKGVLQERNGPMAKRRDML